MPSAELTLEQMSFWARAARMAARISDTRQLGVELQGLEVEKRWSPRAFTAVTTLLNRGSLCRCVCVGRLSRSAAAASDTEGPVLRVSQIRGFTIARR